jgi:hypothetical protein
MKTFVLTVRIDNDSDLETALHHAAVCVSDDPDRYDEMTVDETDEMYGDTGVMEIELQRTA